LAWLRLPLDASSGIASMHLEACVLLDASSGIASIPLDAAHDALGGMCAGFFSS
jgi:hypothetical protein